MEAQKKRKILSSSEIQKLIDVWRSYVPKLTGNIKNSHIYKKMCEELDKVYSIKLSEVELRTRINNLTKKYRTEKRKMGPSGGSPSDWEYFSLIHEFLGSFKSNNVQEMMEEVGCFEDTTFFPKCSPTVEVLSRSENHYSSSTSIELLSTSARTPPSISTPEIPKKNFKRKLNYEAYLDLAGKEEKVFETYINKYSENDS